MQVVYQKGGEYKAYKTLVAAKFNGINVASKIVDPTKESFDLNPWKRLPYLQLDSGVIAESNAMARHVGRIRPDTELLGAKFATSCEVDSWMEFCRREIEINAGALVWAHQGNISLQSVDVIVDDLSKALLKVESKLAAGGPFLMGKELTLADITIVCSLLDIFTLVADKKFRAQFPKVEAWFSSCISMPQFQAVLQGKGIKLCDSNAGGFRFAPPSRSNSVMGTGSTSISNPAESSAVTNLGACPPSATSAATASATSAASAGKSAGKNNSIDKQSQKKEKEMPWKKDKAEKEKAAAATKETKENEKTSSVVSASAGGSTQGTPEEQAALAAIKEKVRSLKTAGADKAEVDAAIVEMKRLKEVCGEVDPPKKKKK